MKKFISILALSTIVLFNCNAQESKGVYSFDINFHPAAIFDASAGSMFTMPYIKARYFIAPDMAARIGFGLGFDSETTYPNPQEDDYEKTVSSSLTFAPGLEKHFGSEKLVAYLGAELPITRFSEKLKGDIGGTTYDVKNPNGNAYLGIGLNFICGVDYYLLNNFYIGAELAPGFLYTKYKDTEDANGDVTDKGRKETSFYLAASSGIRIGVRF